MRICETGPRAVERHLSHSYGSDEPLEPDVEREIFAHRPREPERRLGLARHLMTGVSAAPNHISTLTAAEERALFGPTQ